MHGWQECTQKIHVLELYDEFILTILLKVHCGNLATMFVEPCDNLPPPCQSQPCHCFKIQGCAKVVTRL